MCDVGIKGYFYGNCINEKKERGDGVKAGANVKKGN
jgi:hypothetical protein